MNDALAKTAEIKGRSLWQDAWARLLRNKAALTAIVLLLIISVLVIAAPWLSPFEFDAIDWDLISTPPA